MRIVGSDRCFRLGWVAMLHVSCTNRDPSTLCCGGVKQGTVVLTFWCCPRFETTCGDRSKRCTRSPTAPPNCQSCFRAGGGEPEYIDAILQGRALGHPRLAIARGEVEEGLVDALEAISREGGFDGSSLAQLGLAIPNPNGGWKSRGRFRDVADLGRLPSPYLEGALTPADMGGMVLIEVARGCLFRCHFCLSCNYPKQQPRSFPIARIVDEIQYAAQHHAKAVGLLCSGLNYDIDMLEAVASAFEAIPEEIRPSLESTVHLSLLDERRFKAVMRLPWRRMIVGLQSANPAALALMHRQVDLDGFRTAIEKVAEVHTPVVELILGLPGDDLKGFVSTMRFVLDLPVDVEVYHLRLDPGSWFMRDREKLGIEADFRETRGG